MVSLLIIILLAYGFYTGYRVGLVMQAIRLVGYIFTFLIATRYFDVLSGWLALFIPFPALQPDSQLALYTEQQSFFIENAFYNALTFLVIALLGWLLTNILSILFTKVMYYEVMGIVNRVLGGVINLFVVYFIIFMVLFILSLIPVEFIQQQFVNNPLLFWIVDSTPVLSNFVDNLWVDISSIGL